MAQRLQVVVEDRLAEAVKALADRDGRTVSEWTRLLLDGVVARAESNGALELPGWCVGCGAKAGKGELVCRECAALMDAEDADVPHYEATVLSEVPLTPGQKRQAKFTVNPAMPCTHDLAAKRKVSFGFVQDCIKCGAVVRV